jgi:D-alanyl-D-alanine carboxypeptidase
MNAKAQRDLQEFVTSNVRAPESPEVVVAMNCPVSGGVIEACCGEWQGAPVNIHTPFLIASTSKMFGTAMILQLVAQGRLGFETPMKRFFKPGEVEGLHRLGAQDWTGAITIGHLLSHRSGLADYFEGKRKDGTRFATALLAGRDRRYGFKDVVGMVRHDMHARFIPGSGRSAFYSDTNFYLLGEIIQRVDNMPLDECLQRRILAPLGLQNTTFFRAGVAHLPLRNGARILNIPEALASMPLDGGMVSTAADLLVFTRAFFGGRLFPAHQIALLRDWRRIFFPLQSGVGILKFELPRWMTVFRKTPQLIGHSGISGAFAFHNAEHDLSIVGTVNQLADRSRPYRLMLKAMNIAIAARGRS